MGMVCKRFVASTKIAHFVLAMFLAIPFASEVLAAETSTFQVTATVNAACSVSAINLAFGVYVPPSVIDIDGTLTVDVLCTTGTAYAIGLDAGTGAGATVATRRMTAGGNTLDYSLYQNTQRTTVWGDTVGVDTVAVTGTGATQTATVFGQLFGSQNAAAGSYLDTVTVTITF